jgi:hypothetical protein
MGRSRRGQKGRYRGGQRVERVQPETTGQFYSEENFGEGWFGRTEIVDK